MLNKKVNRSTNIKKTKSFLSKLYEILKDITYKEIISWNNEGNGIIIKDVSNLCKIILPKYFKHNNYSSFIRQLNIYGFYKSQGILKEGEGFEHKIFCKEITKEQVKEIEIPKRKRELCSEENTINNNAEDINFKSISQDNTETYETNDFHMLLNKIEENSKLISELKTEIKDLSNKSNSLNKKLEQFENNLNGHSILLEKIIKNKSNIRINNMKKYKNIFNINELFKKYLYHLKIYSPFVSISNSKIININKQQKGNERNNDSINNMHIFSNNNAIIESISKQNSFLKEIPCLDNIQLNLNDNDSSFSLLCFYKDIK